MSISSRSSRSRSLPAQAAFTLIELLVVISIMLILTSAFLIRQQSFDSATVLRSLAYSIALSVRQAQLYGTSIRDTGSFSGGSYARAYGLYIDQGNAQASPSTYILFADSNNNGRYDSGTDLVTNTFRLSKGYSITKFCADSTCWSAASPNISSLTILFKRPNTDACFASSAQPGACADGATAVYSSGYIQVKSNTDSRSVSVTLTGQISVGGAGT